jgi:putative transposase
MESIIGLFKTEEIAPTVFHDGPYKAPRRRRVRRCRLGRLVQPQTPARVLGWLTPVKYEQDHYAALSREPQPA